MTDIGARLLFISPNEADRNGEQANMVDALFEISRALHRIADAMEVKPEERKHK